MTTPVLEILLYLSATFLLGLALGWAVWGLGTKQEIGAAMSERDFWKNSFDKERLRGGSSRGLGEGTDQEDDQTYAGTRASKSP